MLIYIAGSSSDLARVKRWQARVAEFTAKEVAEGHSGIEITHDWVAAIEARGEANPQYDTVYDRLAWANDDLRGVRESNLLWVLMPPGQSDGAMYETGYAHAMDIPVVFSGPGCTRTIFTANHVCYVSDESAWDYIADRYYTSQADYDAPRMWR